MLLMPGCARFSYRPLLAETLPMLQQSTVPFPAFPYPAQYVLLLWLSMLVLIPFDIAIVDSSLAATPTPAASSGSNEVAASQPAAPAYPPLVGTILELCQRYLASPGSTREMAAVVLGRLLTRPDMAPALAAFLDWGCAALAGTDDSQRASFLVPGRWTGWLEARLLKLGLPAGG